ncbi:MAG: FMN-binding protein [Lachnospiraceae bacterium]|nr:FMN-binding protein [Lachnospiraceae bacterium]
MKKKILTLVIAAIVFAAAFAGCDEDDIIPIPGMKKVQYKDGTYTAQSDVRTEEEAGYAAGYGEVTIVIEGGKVVDCEFKTYDPEGNLKDENFGKTEPEEPEEPTEPVEGEEGEEGETQEEDTEEEPEYDTEGMYTDAQFAISAAQEYARMLADTGSLSKVDAISGASYNYSMFKEAVNLALEQAVIEEE